MLHLVGGQLLGRTASPGEDWCGRLAWKAASREWSLPRGQPRGQVVGFINQQLSQPPAAGRFAVSPFLSRNLRSSVRRLLSKLGCHSARRMRSSGSTGSSSQLTSESVKESWHRLVMANAAASCWPPGLWLSWLRLRLARFLVENCESNG
uniref:HDC12767 n=1 Tax=Drosophila melanogaster TaxID=7227 RepID=Q6IKD6_DROME|nr:TPA_inf: HDC12767 [Drosophila melanogaster]